MLTVVNAWSPTVSIDEITLAKSRLESTATFKCHKAMSLFPTGQKTMEQAAAAIAARAADKMISGRMEKIQKALADAGAMHVFTQDATTGTAQIAKCVGGTLCLVGGRGKLIQDFATEVVAVRSNASRTWLEQHKDVLQKCDDAQRRFAAHVKAGLPVLGAFSFQVGGRFAFRGCRGRLASGGPLV